jgi:membrane-bound ClpP family serine protease
MLIGWARPRRILSLRLHMTAFGIVLLLLGLVLVIAEAHVPGGILGVLGGVTLVGAVLVLAGAAGAGAAVAVPVGVALGLGAAAWGVIVARGVAPTRRARVRSGAEGLSGRVGVVRSWSEPDGQVFVDGALWRAQHSWGPGEEDALHEGDRVVVERVAGLTLCVRRAEEWELIA